jgi:hypothetical protein
MACQAMVAPPFPPPPSFPSHLPRHPFHCRSPPWCHRRQPYLYPSTRSPSHTPHPRFPASPRMLFLRTITLLQAPSPPPSLPQIILPYHQHNPRTTAPKRRGTGPRLFFERTTRGLPNIFKEGESVQLPKYRDYWPTKSQLQPLQKKKREKERKNKKPLKDHH